jgi:flagellar basal body rod protein FlgB
MKLFDTTLAHLERSLDVRLVRQNVLSGDLANVDTPNYHPRDVDFAAAMASAEGGAGAQTVAATDPRHLGGSDPSGPDHDRAGRERAGVRRRRARRQQEARDPALRRQRRRGVNRGGPGWTF